MKEISEMSNEEKTYNILYKSNLILDYASNILRLTLDKNFTPNLLIPSSKDSITSMITSIKCLSNGIKALTNKINIGKYNVMFYTRLDTIDFTPRTENCLRRNKILFIGDIVQYTEQELLAITNLGKKSLNEIKTMLNIEFSLSLGMILEDWDSQKLRELYKNGK